MDSVDWKSYFHFSHKERIGIIALVILIGIITASPLIIERIGNEPKIMTLTEEEKKWMGVLENKQNKNGLGETIYDTIQYARPEVYIEKGYQLFSFDPNTLSPSDWKRLGLRDRTIATIQKFLSSGGRFKKPEDIGKIYGLRRDEFERLLPYVRIASRFAANKPAHETSKSSGYSSHDHSSRLISINEADTADLIALPGIGSKLANRIISFREKLGGFYSVDQVSETYGLADSVFQKIKGNLFCDTSALKKIDINKASQEELGRHPYIRWKLAATIVAYRQEHGPFKTLSELSQLFVIPEEALTKLLPYLSVQ
jgi:competence ComEA-like helix-hairpin-helix protein